MSRALILPLVLVVTAYHLTDEHHKFVRADDTLIHVECHNAEVPEVCIQCLKSDNRSENADRVGIAEILVGCLKNHANTTQTYMTTLASTTKDGSLKMMLLQCGQAVSSAKSELARATSELQNGQYDNAEHTVNEALLSEVSCSDISEKYESAIAEDIVYEMRIYQELSEAAKRIIERL